MAQKVIFGLWKHCFQKAHRKSKTIFRILGFSNFYTWRFSISSSCSWPSFLSFASFSGINHSQLGPFEEMSDVDEWTTSSGNVMHQSLKARSSKWSYPLYPTIWCFWWTICSYKTHPIPSHPIQSHPIPSNPIRSHPIPSTYSIEDDDLSCSKMH